MLHKPLGVSEPFRGTSEWGEYGDAIQNDYNVGRIFDTLKNLQIDDETIVVYASDNGRGPGRTPEQKIQGRKLSTYEGGIRVPAIAWGLVLVCRLVNVQGRLCERWIAFNTRNACGHCGSGRSCD